MRWGEACQIPSDPGSWRAPSRVSTGGGDDCKLLIAAMLRTVTNALGPREPRSLQSRLRAVAELGGRTALGKAWSHPLPRGLQSHVTVFDTPNSRPI
jgi:hypothetical protein